MKINLMTNYAIKAVRSIVESGNVIVTSNAIAEKEDMPHGVLAKVLRKLRINNLVTSHQGRGQIAGGYALCAPVSEITLLKIVEIMEGPIQFSFEENNRCLNGFTVEYERITEVLRQEMSRYTLAELMQPKNPEAR